MPTGVVDSSTKPARPPDGKRLEGRDHPGVFFLDFATARARRVADLPGAPDAWGGIALSPDGRSVLFSKIEQDTSDIMLIEGFR